MSNDKLNATARAAGFAMACDEAAAGAARTFPAMSAVPQTGRAEPTASKATALVPVAKVAKPSSGWAFMGFNFWKTA